MGSRGGWGVRSLDAEGDAAISWMIDPAPEHRFAYVGDRGSELFLITDYEAPNWRIVAADFERTGLESLREVASDCS